MKIHICLISAQAAANLLPALDDTLRPDKILMVISPAMKKQAGYLEIVLKERGIFVEKLVLKNEHDFSEIENDLMDWALQNEEDEIMLNLTGGTKLMALAAQSVAKAANWEIFYVDMDTDKAIWPYKKSAAPQKLAEKLKLKHYLQSYGFSLPNRPTAAQSPHSNQRLAKTLVTQIGSLEFALSRINWLAQQAENKNKLQVEIDTVQKDCPGFEVILREFEQAGHISVKDSILQFNDEKSRNYVKGGWLELHVFDALTRIPGIQDKAADLEVLHEETGAKNQFDAIFMAHNRAFIIECKTGRMDKPESPKANDALFKLAENCKRIGSGTKGIFITYRDLKTPEKRLANALNIDVISGVEINRLDERMQYLIRK